MSGITSLTDKDRIFTNVYGFQGADLKSAQLRGNWDKTADLMKIGQDEIIEIGCQVASALEVSGRAVIRWETTGEPDPSHAESYARLLAALQLTLRTPAA